MPTYVYKFVDTDETIEIVQSFTDDTLTEAVHPDTGESLPVKKVFQPVGVTFKGDGFYKNDSRKSKTSTAPSPSDSSKSDSSKSDSSKSDASKSDASKSSGASTSKSDSSTSSSTASSSD